MRDIFFNLEKKTRKRFAKHFLQSVHCEIAFSPLSMESLLSHQESLAKEFKALGFTEMRQIAQTQFTFGQDEQSVKVTNNAVPIGLAFVSSNPKREFQFLTDRFVFSSHRYSGFEAFKDELKKIVELCAKTTKLKTESQKIGFRKINSVIVEDTKSYDEACAIFNPALFGVLSSGLLSPDSLKAAENVVVAEKDNSLCVLKGRISTLPQPNAYECSLDFDLVNKQSQSFEKIFQTTLDSLNDLHYDLFMWAITEDLIKVMEA